MSNTLLEVYIVLNKQFKRKTPFAVCFGRKIDFVDLEIYLLSNTI